MADVGGIILQAAQGIVQQNQNQQRLQMQAIQLGNQLQQANRTFQLQQEELAMRKSMQEQKEEEFKLQQEKVDISSRAVGVQEGQLELQKEKEEMNRGLNRLLTESEINLKNAQAAKINKEISSTASPSDAVTSLTAKNPGFMLSLDKRVREVATSSARAEFLTKGYVQIGGKKIVRPPDMPLLAYDEVQDELSSIVRSQAALEPQLRNAQAAAAAQEGKDTGTARRARQRAAEFKAEYDRLQQGKRKMNEYSLAYSQIEAAGADEQWKATAWSEMGMGNPLLKQFMNEIGVAEAERINTPEGQVLISPTQRLSFIGGSAGKNPGKYEKYQSDVGVTYGQRLRSAWDSIRLSEKGTPAWDSGMSLLSSLARDQFPSKEHQLAFIQSMRQEWRVDFDGPEEKIFQRVMRDFLTERGARSKR